MVRLKVEAEEKIREQYHLFQFHNGSIKSSRYSEREADDEMFVFQFHNGSIKSQFCYRIRKNQ